MTVAQPALDLPPINQTPFAAVVARQLSVWPFGARTTRLFLLVDPNVRDDTLKAGVLRAMQQAYFGSDGCSQTRAVREAALAAHYVLRHHNRDVLPTDQINAATAVAALRGDVAFVALAGHAAAFAWQDGDLTGQRGILRLPRPLGLEQDPVITLWSTSLQPGDRLVLVCGATWRRDSSRTVQQILASTTTASEAEEQLRSTLGDSRPVGVLVVSPDGSTKPVRRGLRLVNPVESIPPVSMQPPAQRRPFAFRQWLISLFGVALLAMVVTTALIIALQPPRVADDRPTQMLALPQRVDWISPAMAVRLGPSAADVVDMSVGDAALYTLDVAEGSVRAFRLDATDQQPTPDTLVTRAGTPLDAAGRRLSTPVAIEYVGHSLVLVDAARSVVEIDRDRHLSVRNLPASSTWQAVGALGTSPQGGLLFLDSGARRVLAYPPFTPKAVDPPHLVLDASSGPALAWDHAAEMIGDADSVVVRFDDGSVHRFDSQAVDQVLTRQSIRAIAADRTGGLYLADTAGARILHVGPDGRVIRELRDPTLAGVREIQASLDGRQLFGLVASGILVFDIPPV